MLEGDRDSGGEFDGAVIAAMHSPDPLVVVDSDGVVRWAGSTSARLMGYRDDEVLDRHLLEFVHPDDVNKAVGAAVEAGRRPGFHLPVRFRIRNRDGAWVDSDVNGKTFDRDGETWFVLSIRALAEQNVVDDRRSRIERLLQRASVDCSRARWFEVDELIRRNLEALADVVG